MYLVKYVNNSKIYYDIITKNKTKCLGDEPNNIEEAFHYYKEKGLKSIIQVLFVPYDEASFDYNILLEFHHNQSFEDIKKDYPELFI